MVFLFPFPGELAPSGVQSVAQGDVV
jgi:hypothetical protein